MTSVCACACVCMCVLCSVFYHKHAPSSVNFWNIIELLFTQETKNTHGNRLGVPVYAECCQCGRCRHPQVLCTPALC